MNDFLVDLTSKFPRLTGTINTQLKLTTMFLRYQIKWNFLGKGNTPNQLISDTRSWSHSSSVHTSSHPFNCSLTVYRPKFNNLLPRISLPLKTPQKLCFTKPVPESNPTAITLCHEFMQNLIKTTTGRITWTVLAEQLALSCPFVNYSTGQIKNAQAWCVQKRS